jgi:hypothetical protein
MKRPLVQLEALEARSVVLPCSAVNQVFPVAQLGHHRTLRLVAGVTAIVAAVPQGMCQAKLANIMVVRPVWNGDPLRTIVYRSSCRHVSRGLRAVVARCEAIATALRDALRGAVGERPHATLAYLATT